jgi:DNA invertase Pin-like site-specific DNA recombinase
MRIALYAGVSTDDQDTENQLAQLREWADRAGHQIVREYVEHESGRKADRPAFLAMFDGAARRRFDCVLFWALDRFSREGMVPTIMHLQRLASYGVAFHSYTEPHLATDNELARNIILATLSYHPSRSSRRRRSPRGPRRGSPEPEHEGSGSAGRRSGLGSRRLYGLPWPRGRAS